MARATVPKRVVLPKPKEHPYAESKSNDLLQEMNQMAPVSPAEPKAQQNKKRKVKVPTMKNYGIVTGFRNNNSPV